MTLVAYERANTAFLEPWHQSQPAAVLHCVQCKEDSQHDPSGSNTFASISCKEDNKKNMKMKRREQLLLHPRVAINESMCVLEERLTPFLL